MEHDLVVEEDLCGMADSAVADLGYIEQSEWNDDQAELDVLGKNDLKEVDRVPGDVKKPGVRLYAFIPALQSVFR